MHRFVVHPLTCQHPIYSQQNQSCTLQNFSYLCQSNFSFYVSRAYIIGANTVLFSLTHVLGLCMRLMFSAFMSCCDAIFGFPCLQCMNGAMLWVQLYTLLMVPFLQTCFLADVASISYKY